MVIALVVLGLVLVAVAGASIALAVSVARRTPVDGSGSLAGELRAQALRLDRIADGMQQGALGQEALREGLQHTRSLVAEIRTRDEERRVREDESRAAVHRLEATFLGASSRGRVGETVVWEALQTLPPSMVDAGFRVNGKVVEFSLKLPDGRRLPVDSKWASMAEVEGLETAEGEERIRLARIVEQAAAARAREVAKYIDPSVTTPFGVAAVPDAVHAVLRRAHIDAFGWGVLLVPYSAALPTLLALYALCSRLSTDGGDVGAMASEVGTALDAIERALENQIEKAAKMSQNAASDIRTHLGRARGALGRALAAEDLSTLGPEDAAGVAALRAVE